MGEIQDGSAVFQILDKRKDKVRQEYVDLVYPVGIVVAIANDKKPAFMQYGTWEKVAEDRVLQGASESNAPGKKIDAGLPNIKGSFNAVGVEDAITNTYSGSIYKSGSKTNFGSGHATGPQPTIAFDASKSNSIYGKSTTVQPPAYVVAYWQRTE